MARFRTIPTAYKWLKETDPDTGISLNGLRTLVKKGAVKSVMLGRKPLVSLESIENLLSRPQELEPVHMGTIREISENKAL